MPFAVRYKVKTKIKSYRVPLHVQGSMIIKGKNIKGGRVFLSTFQEGSITLEAALVAPLFLLAMVGMLYFMVIININLNIQIAIEKTADGLMTKMYAVQELSDAASYIGWNTQEDSDEEDAVAEIKGLLSKGVTAAWLRERLVSEIGKDSLDNTYIVNGAAGLSFIESEFDIEKGIGDIVVSYRVKLPFVPYGTKTMEFTQRCRFRFWTGTFLEDEGDGDTVYITTNGTVYHRNLSCSHLNLSISKTTYAEMQNLRNESGGKYAACAYCVNGILDDASVVYVTDSGTKYHSRLGCSGLKRGIITVDISEVGDMPPCSSCGQ